MGPNSLHMSAAQEPKTESIAPPVTPPAQQAPPTLLKPGDVLGGCVVESFIARGGMGELYRARKANLECAVALKVLLPELLSQESVLSRFLREAKLAANLSHPSIVRVYDIGQERGLYYIVMEFVEGRDLRDLVMKDGALPFRTAFRIARQIADALEYAHRRGIVHRDVKPANILVSADGSAKLTDLGLARAARQDSEVTVAGEILGTPLFMSPEQCRGEPIDGRSDLYSLGATLYMMLSGSPPFRGDSTPIIIQKVLNERPQPLKSLVPEIPEKAAAIVQRLMAKHPGARYQSGRELVADINELLIGKLSFTRESKPAAAVAAPSSEASGFSWPLVFLLFAIALVLLGYGLWPKQLTSLPFPRNPPEKTAPAGKGVGTASRRRRGPSAAATGPRRGRGPGAQRTSRWIPRFPEVQERGGDPPLHPPGRSEQPPAPHFGAPLPQRHGG